ncbi:MAG TPA: tRNA (adenosine(37)-N6)-dimethylallyltransferase MiaA [Mucilaginibacter sp.]|jgi:tRNA dimethylallyltransferase|nr:tRNA (adenosine(37)-N6)-dimethylallyltransferase MiaA [Mucilaginibacter sp.]
MEPKQKEYLSGTMNHLLPSPKKLIVIAGPTAVGKTAAAIKLAQQLKTEIISADSRQFYREMSIGTAKPDAAELAQAKHHFIDSHSITENFTVGNFEKEALQLLDELFKTCDKVIMVGGSGLFIQAVTQGFDDLPTADPEIREELNRELAKNGIERLQQKLKEADLNYYNQVDLNNPQRLIRALEVFEATGKPFSSYRKATINTRPFESIKIVLDLPREELYNRINQRVDMMVEQGLIEEVRSLLPYRHLNALNTVGYTELFDHFDGKTDLLTAIDLIKQSTRRFAKRQLTWFRKDKDMKWIRADDPNLIGEIIQQISY